MKVSVIFPSLPSYEWFGPRHSFTSRGQGNQSFKQWGALIIIIIIIIIIKIIMIIIIIKSLYSMLIKKTYVQCFT